MTKEKQAPLTKSQWHQRAKQELQAAFSEVVLSAEGEWETQKKGRDKLRIKIKRNTEKCRDQQRKCVALEKKIAAKKTPAQVKRLKAMKSKLMH